MSHRDVTLLFGALSALGAVLSLLWLRGYVPNLPFLACYLAGAGGLLHLTHRRERRLTSPLCPP